MPGERLVALHCHFGLVPADDDSPQAGSCVPMGGPEMFGDLFTSNTELAARDTAPFASAPGAYLHAIAQRGAVPTAGSATGTGGT